ncbi:MAG TPA: hypothetical protein VHT71_13340 [Methylomirabilota bacterium]|nr:hypothetical protein [Methylomirabilota bacterium]
MRRLTSALLAVTLAVLASAGPASGGIADRVAATFALMAGDFVKAFQPIEALVVSREGNEIFLDVSASAGAQVGQEYTVFRKGDMFQHPLTGRPLGYYEEILGHAQIVRVYPNFSAAVYLPLPDTSPPRASDGARISRARIKVAVTPVYDLTASSADLRRVPFMLAAALRGSQRFQVVDPLTVSDMVASGTFSVGEMLARPERSMRAARLLEVAGWIVPMLLDRRGVTYLDVTYMSAVTGTALISRRLPLVSANATEEPRFPWEPRPED